MIPNIPLDDPSIAGFRVKEPKKIVCDARKPLTEPEGLTLKLHLERASQFGLPSDMSINCSYQGILRITKEPDKCDGRCDRRWKLNTTVLQITEETTNIEVDDGILVRCYNSTYHTVYKNVHYFIQLKRYMKKLNKHQKDEESEKKGDLRKLNVIMVGNDAVSRSNMLRHLPKSYAYLMEELGAIDLRGYNKIGDNTFPNMITILTGYSFPVNNNHSCVRPGSKNLDDCPFVWKNFSQKGYVTVYGEDVPFMGTFRYAKSGFCQEPTDFYNSPIAFASDTYVGHMAGLKGLDGFICQAEKLTAKVLYDYSLLMAATLQGVPYFGYYWLSTLSHESLTLISAEDQTTLEYLQAMKREGYLEDTIMLFMSDHGMRYGPIRYTLAGLLEERLPYMLIVLPTWFEESFPEAVKNLRLNSERLTSNYDIFATLHDLHSKAYADLRSR
ncbi:hypothetical protein SK128_021693 [Halocaridina rubra]|uniref:DUF229 domain-containing protein n=1 Tax=Halocaridina rubra TaxID=373956 RepID=A0AAN8WFY9_HALRR